MLSLLCTFRLSLDLSKPAGSALSGGEGSAGLQSPWQESRPPYRTWVQGWGSPTFPGWDVPPTFPSRQRLLPEQCSSPEIQNPWYHPGPHPPVHSRTQLSNHPQLLVRTRDSRLSPVPSGHCCPLLEGSGQPLLGCPDCQLVLTAKLQPIVLISGHPVLHPCYLSLPALWAAEQDWCSV